MRYQPTGRYLKGWTGIFLWMLALVPVSVPAQEQIERQGSDPLQGKQQVDTARIQAMLEEAESLRFNMIADSAIALAQEAIRLSDDAGYEVGKAEGFSTIGGVYYDQSNFEQAQVFFNRALSVYEKEADTTGISRIQNSLGTMYSDLGDYPMALEYYLKSLRNGQRMSDTIRIATAYMNLGTVYQEDESTYPQAKESYQEAIDMFGKKNYKIGVAGTQLNFGDWYVEVGEGNLEREQKAQAIKDFQEAIPYLEDALEGFREVGYYPAYPLNSLGRAYFGLGQYDTALRYYGEALVEAGMNPNPSVETTTYLGLGEVRSKQGLYAQAIEDFQKALELAKQTGVLSDQEESYEGLSEAYAALNQFDRAFEAQQNYSVVRESLKAADYAKEMSRQRVSFGLENAERENQLLKTQNSLNELQIERDARAKQLLMVILGLFLAIIAGFIFQYFYIRRTNKRLAFERNRSDQILLNILPQEVAEELKEYGYTKAKEFRNITVLFTDFKAFSLIAERVSAEMLVKSVDYYFKNFDEITERHNLEKIKTIGDAYMCAGGIPTPNKTHARDSFEAALEILQFVKATELNPPKGIYPFQIRIGLNSGPVVAGVVGTKKFAYDIWGNTVNIAARMESGSVPGRINVSENIYLELKGDYEFTYRGELEVKNQSFKMYFAEIPESVPA